MSKPFAFHELPAGAFPFVVSFVDMETHKVLDEIKVTEPGAVTVPSFRPRKVAVEIRYADGGYERYEP